MEGYWDLKKAAEYLNVDPSWIRHLINRGKIQAEKIGGAWIVKEEIIKKYNQERGESHNPNYRGKKGKKQ